MDGTSPSAVSKKNNIRQAFSYALRLACLRLGATWPNPPVGCAVLDNEGNILSAAAHLRAGGAHAEILALEALKNFSLAPKAAILAVTLEPCAHHGKTPPCVAALLKSDIAEIWIGAKDPNETAAGGAEILEKAGKKVVRLWESDDPFFEAVKNDCQALLTPFLTRMTAKRPWMILKQALDENGSMIPPKGKKTFTSRASLRLAHLLRRSCGGIITGRGTILADQPLFTIRHIDDFHEAPERWIIACGQQMLPEKWLGEIKHAGFHFRHVQTPQEAVKTLAEAGVEMGLIEAGPQLLAAFKEAGLVDEVLKIHKEFSKDSLVLEKFSQAPSPLLLLQKYSPDWPKHLQINGKPPLASSIEPLKDMELKAEVEKNTFPLKTILSTLTGAS